MKILVVDDEPLARMRLVKLLSHLGHEDVIEAQDGLQATAMAQKHHPDLVFLDIQMPGGNGLEAAADIKKLMPSVTVIFCTAHDEYALKAFDLAAGDYLLKPVVLERLGQALEKVGVTNEVSKITVKQGQNTYAIPVDEMICFLAEDKYVVAHLAEKEFLLDLTLTQLEKSHPQLLRLHRNCLIHRSYLQGIHMDENHKPHAILKNLDLQPAISRRQLSAVKKELN